MSVVDSSDRSRSSTGTYSTGGYDASCNVRALSDSPITLSPTRTRTCLPAGSTVIGWDASGIFCSRDIWGEPRHTPASSRDLPRVPRQRSGREGRRKVAAARCCSSTTSMEENHEHHRQPADQRRRRRRPCSRRSTPSGRRTRSPRSGSGPATPGYVAPTAGRRTPASSAPARRCSTGTRPSSSPTTPRSWSAGPGADPGRVPAARDRRLPHRRDRQRRLRARRRADQGDLEGRGRHRPARHPGPVRTTRSATATGRSASRSRSTGTPTTSGCAASSSSRAAAPPCTTRSPTRPPSSSTSSRTGCVSADHRTSIDTVVIGAGHAGLSVSRLLTRAGRPHVVLDRGRVGERWRSERGTPCAC